MTTPAPVKPEHVAAALEVLRKMGQPKPNPYDVNVVAQALADAEARGAADVEARIDAAIAKRGLVYVTDRASLRGWILSTSQGRSLTTAERVLLDILEPGGKT
jgi:hypothetical protein